MSGIACSIGGDAGQTGSTLMQQGYHTVLDPLVAKGDVKIVMDQFTPAWKSNSFLSATPLPSSATITSKRPSPSSRT